jgi:ankyrin repeat protein
MLHASPFHPIPQDGATPLFIASQNGHIHSDVVNILLRNGAGVNVAMNDGTTPLFIASQNGHSDVVNILLQNGAGVNVAANDGVMWPRTMGQLLCSLPVAMDTVM